MGNTKASNSQNDNLTDLTNDCSNLNSKTCNQLSQKSQVLQTAAKKMSNYSTQPSQQESTLVAEYNKHEMERKSKHYNPNKSKKKLQPLTYTQLYNCTVDDIPNPYKLPSTIKELTNVAAKCKIAQKMNHPFPEKCKETLTQQQWDDWCKQYYMKKYNAAMYRIEQIEMIQDRQAQLQLQSQPQVRRGLGLLSRPRKVRDHSHKGLLILRGLSGAGKTTLANKLAKRSKQSKLSVKICSEDKYHWSSGEEGIGTYKFQPNLVFKARDLCNNEIKNAIQQGVGLIVLDNYNARIGVYEKHVQLAVQHGYRFRIIEFVSNRKLIDMYRARSYKKFPKQVYLKLLRLWEYDPRSEIINPTFVNDTNVKNGSSNINLYAGGIGSSIRLQLRCSIIEKFQNNTDIDY